MKTLNKKFKHSSWFKGQNLTTAEAIDLLAENSDIYIIKKANHVDNLLEDITYSEYLTDGRYKYKISEEEKKFYEERKIFWKKFHTDFYKNWIEAHGHFQYNMEYIAAEQDAINSIRMKMFA